MKDPASFVRITAGIFLALSILCLLVDAFGFLMFHLFLQKTFATMDYANSMGPVNAWRMNHMDAYYTLHSLVSLTALAGSVGLLYKKPWSPSVFFYFLSAILVFHLTNLGMSIATACTLPDTTSVNGMPLPRGMMMFSTGLGMLWIAVLVAVYAWLWFSFRKKEIQEIFN